MARIRLISVVIVVIVNIINIVECTSTTPVSSPQNIPNKIEHGPTCGQQKDIGVQHNSCSKKIQQRCYPRDCKEVLKNGNHVTGVYEIFPEHADGPFQVLCDMETRKGGWTHIQKRFDGSQDFFLGWRDYKFGFGNFDGEFWLGLEKIYLLTGSKPTELLVEVTTKNNSIGYAYYSSFGIGSESGGYKLEHLSGYDGDIGDSLHYHVGSKFSTKDLDFTEKNCATIYPGGWWYHDCLWSNLNGKHINIDLPSKYRYQGLQWDTFVEGGNSHSKSRMLIRSVN